MKIDDIDLHLRGASKFIDDLPEPAGLLHGALFFSHEAHARLLNLDLTLAEAIEGVCGIFTAKDIPGQNQVGRIIQDEPLLAEQIVDFVGQPIALVVATSPAAARRAVAAIKARYEPLSACFDPVEAHAKGDLIAPSRTIKMGDTTAAFATCAHVVEGSCDSGGQEHLYMETQGSLAFPLEGERVKIIAGTQSPTGVQLVTSWVLALPMHAIEVETVRLGGAFGGKEDQATPFAIFCALGARLTGRPVKIVLSRGEDMRLTGKRHPYRSHYKLGLDAQGKMVAYEVTFFQNAGAAADLSTSILERSLLHATGPYFIPHVRATGHSCRTNLPPFTAFRGFGAPQAVFVMECALTHAAAASGMAPEKLRAANLLKDGDLFYFGMRAEKPLAELAMARVSCDHDFAALRSAADAFNATSLHVKKGVALMPICFGISFTSQFLNQAGALVHLYMDGTLHVSSGAVEMGQGVNRKLRRIAAMTLGIDESLVTVAPTNTSRVANSSPTAASSGADLNGGAVQLACAMLRDRIMTFAQARLQTSGDEVRLHGGQLVGGDGRVLMGWRELIQAAYMNRVNLSAQALYTTPGLSYDKSREQGTPFAYHVYGACITEVLVDLLRGTFALSKVYCTHDAGRPLLREVDIGQIEGGLMQGIGWATMENLRYGSDGRLMSHALANYKVPDLHFIPQQFEVSLLEAGPNPHAVYGSKGIGEPPLLYGLATYFAIWDALDAVRPGGRREPYAFHLPLSPERILTWIMKEESLLAERVPQG